MIAVATTEQELARLCSRLTEFGATRARTVEPSPGRAVLLADVDDPWLLEQVVATLRSEGEMAVMRPGSGPKLEKWLSDTVPVVVADRVTICAAWSEHDRSAMPGLVELGSGGFGNGRHPTTRLLVEELVGRTVGEDRVLDVGCGSGVLGLCALELGASQVVAVDIQADAVDSTKFNAVLNGMGSRLEATTATLADIGGTFDVVVANIARAGIVELRADLVASVKPGGWLAVSGISPSQSTQVAEFLRPLVEVNRRTDGDWAVLVLQQVTTSY